jgi:hypothetical protein
MRDEVLRPFQLNYASGIGGGILLTNSIGRIALNEDRLLFGKGCDLSTAVHGRKESLRIKPDEFLGRYHGCHDWPPLKSSECAEDNFL